MATTYVDPKQVLEMLVALHDSNEKQATQIAELQGILKDLMPVLQNIVKGCVMLEERIDALEGKSNG